jgi:parvulin-like peptidyl-prolyl isomerase
MMKISRLLLLPVLALAVVVAAGCGGSESASVPADAVAVVDGAPIAKTALDDLMGRAKITYKEQSRTFPKAGTTEYQSLQQQAVAFLVKREEYDVEAAALDVKVTDKQISDRMDEIQKQYYENDPKKFAAQVKKLGFTDATLKAELRANLVSDGLFEAVTKDVKVADADLKKYYDENKATYTTPESRDVRHILVAKKDLALQIRQQLVDGADFAALAKKYSTDPGSKDLGGKYTVTKGQTVPPFEKASFTLETNAISQPVKTQFGYHIIQPTADLKKASITPFASVKKQISTQLLDTKKQEAMVKWDEDLAKKYEDKVSYADGYAPPAAATTPTSTADES